MVDEKPDLSELRKISSNIDVTVPGISQFAQIYNTGDDKDKPAWDRKFNSEDWNYFNSEY